MVPYTSLITPLGVVGSLSLAAAEACVNKVDADTDLLKVNGCKTLLNGVNLPVMSYHQQQPWTGQVLPQSDFDLYRKLGFNIFRYGFSWNILQPDANKSWDNDYYNAMHSNITNMTKDKDVFVILDLHDFGRHSDRFIAESEDAPSAEKLANLWGAIAADFKDLGNVMFGIMNEPEEGASTASVTNYLQASINAIREANATSQYILLPSQAWQGMSTWLKYSQGTLGISDASNRLIYDIHSYLNPERDGATECLEFAQRKDEWQNVTVELRNQSKRAFLSEIGGIASLQCQKSINDALAYLDENKDVWLGWTAWGPQQVQPTPRLNNNNSQTAFFMDCQDGDLLHHAFMQHGSVAARNNRSTCCSPLRDSVAQLPNDTIINSAKAICSGQGDGLSGGAGHLLLTVGVPLIVVVVAVLL